MNRDTYSAQQADGRRQDEGGSLRNPQDAAAPYGTAGGATTRNTAEGAAGGEAEGAPEQDSQECNLVELHAPELELSGGAPSAPMTDAEIFALWNDENSGALSSEDECLALVDELFPSRTEHVPLGRGDDCAELALHSSGLSLALSTDFFIEDVHFRTRYFSPYEVGAKALSGALSDLAGAGAHPLGFSLGLILPQDLPKKALIGILQGLAAVARAYDLTLSGGDIARGPSLSFSVTVWGKKAEDAAGFLRRRVAREQDIIFLIGEAGLARTGLFALEQYGRAACSTYPVSAAAHLFPFPCIPEGRMLARIAGEYAASFSHIAPSNHSQSKGVYPSSAIGLMDLSDGLARDLPRLLGGLGADLSFPPSVIPAEVIEYALAHKLSPEEMFFNGGEEYSLLGTCPPDLWERIVQCIPYACRIGEVRSGGALTYNGAPLTEKGHDHFYAAKPAQPGQVRQSGPDEPVRPAAIIALPGAPDKPSEEASPQPAQTATASGAVALPALSALPDTTELCPQLGGQLNRQLDSCAAELIHLCRQAWQRGLLAGFNGNAGCMIPLTRPVLLAQGPVRAVCLITRSGAAKSLLARKDFAVLCLDTGEHLAGPKASSETRMYLETFRKVYGNLSDIAWIMHAHPPHLLALEMALPEADRLDLPLFEAETYKKQLAVVPAFDPGSSALARAVAEAAGSRRAVWMSRHGLMTHGAHAYDCLGLMEELEQLARVQLLACRTVKSTGK